MLPKQYRLPAQVKLQKPSSFATPLFLVKVSNNALAYSRFGFIISKKEDKRATARNKIRRLFRSCIEDMREEIVTGKDMLFFLKKGIIEKKKENLSAELQEFLRTKQLRQ